MNCIIYALCFNIVLLVSSGVFASDEVSLFRAESQTLNLGQTIVQEIYMDIRVKNIAFDKTVAAVVEEVPGTWVERPATFLRTADEGFEIWRVGYNLPLGVSNDLRFALRYEVNGETFWDNNNGFDYFLDAVQGVMLGASYNVAANQPITSISTQNRATFIYSGSVLIRNVAFEKSVTVVYSTDNWASVNEVNATYSSGPNFDGVEKWNFANVEVFRGSSLQFAIKYEASGVEYWDNNFGSDYSVNFTWLPPFP